MEQVKTTNIISTPEITGNIGSCTSNSIKVETGNYFWYTTEKSVVTNSCTGGVNTYDTWSIGIFPSVVCILGIMILLIIVGSFLDRNNY